MLGLQDALLNQTGALPAAASSSTNTGSIDLELATLHGETEWTRVEFEIDAPALNVTQLPNGDVVTYDVIVSASSNLGTPTAVYAAILTQTGAGGAGAAAATRKFKLPGNLNDYLSGARYLGIRANTGSGTGNCSAASVGLAVNF